MTFDSTNEETKFTEFNAKQGPMGQKPWPIQTVTDCQDSFILSRQLKQLSP